MVPSEVFLIDFTWKYCSCYATGYYLVNILDQKPIPFLNYELCYYKTELVQIVII